MNHPSAKEKQQLIVRLDAHPDAEVSHRSFPEVTGDVSSVCHEGVAAVTTESSSAKCPQVKTSHGQRKWTYDENIELMHCFYLVKSEGLGYGERLKRLWDARNSDKCAISVNTLCCHAQNIQAAHMLPGHDLRRIENQCSHNSTSTDEPLSGDTVEGLGSVAVKEPTEEPPSIVFERVEGNSAVLDALSSKYDGISSANRAESRCLPRISVTKKFNDIVSKVTECMKCLLTESTPSLLQCVHLLYAAAATVADLLHLPQSKGQRSQGCWRLRLERTIQDLRWDLSRLVTGGFPPSGSCRFLYVLSCLHCKYHISSVCSFQVVVETQKQKNYKLCCSFEEVPSKITAPLAK